MKPSILLFSPFSRGGLAEHTFHQTAALQKEGAEVTVLAAPCFLDGRSVPFPILKRLYSPPVRGRSGLLHTCRLLFTLLANQVILMAHILSRRPSLVFFDSYTEYLSPLWVWPHGLLSRVGFTRYGANLHDPVRDYRIGPAWWHRLSVRLGYLPMSFVCVHDDLPSPSPVPPSVEVVKVPMGVYALHDASQQRDTLHKQWGVTAEQRVFLAFGYLRDNKNLHLAFQALKEVPEAFLVLAGSVQSEKDRPFSYYRQLAEHEGLSGRCHLTEGFVDNRELGNLFSGADFVLLTYASSFVSQSGVLNVAAQARKPILASSGPGPLINCVRTFGLGVTVGPDSAPEIARGMRELIRNPFHPDWEAYEAFASWKVNAAAILEHARSAS